MRCVQVAATPACPTAGSVFFRGDLLTEPSPEDIRRAQGARAHLNSVSSIPDRVEYAGFWLRVWAGVIDLCLEAAGALVLTLAIDFVLRRSGRLLGISPFFSKVATGMAFIVILAVGSWLYCAFAESSSWRATVGKRVLGLQVVTSEGDKISFGQAVGSPPDEVSFPVLPDYWLPDVGLDQTPPGASRHALRLSGHPRSDKEFPATGALTGKPEKLSGFSGRAGSFFAVGLVMGPSLIA